MGNAQTSPLHKQTLTGHTDRVHRCAFSPAVDLLATVSYDGTVRLWCVNPDSGQYEAHPEMSIPGMHGCAFSPSGGVLATVTEDHDVHLHDMEPRISLISDTLNGGRGSAEQWFIGCAFSPSTEKPLLATISYGRTVQLWHKIAPDGSQGRAHARPG